MGSSIRATGGYGMAILMCSPTGMGLAIMMTPQAAEQKTLLTEWRQLL